MGWNLLLTGQPGSGKTTLLQRILRILRCEKGGFTTEEMLRHGRRIGFKVQTMNGQYGVLAHKEIKTDHKMGKYFLDIKTFEKLAIPSIHKAIKSCELIVIDEIGKMELQSEDFKTAVTEALDSPKPVLGTIMWGNRHPFVKEIKDRDDVTLFEVTQENVDGLLVHVTEQLKSILQSKK
jgi:nucleoside-triphosphatase